jgi:hypothetical protein
MSNDTKPEFDPRFDPAFQRGFAGPVTRSAPVARPSAPVAKPAPQVAPSPRVAPSPPIIERGPEVRISNEPLAPSTTEVVEDESKFQLRRVNPFSLVLVLLSVVLIGGGLWAVQFAREAFLAVNLSSDIDYVTLQMVIIAAPLAIALGVATALGLLFLLAFRRRNRDR